MHGGQVCALSSLLRVPLAGNPLWCGQGREHTCAVCVGLDPSYSPARVREHEGSVHQPPSRWAHARSRCTKNISTRIVLLLPTSDRAYRYAFLPDVLTVATPLPCSCVHLCPSASRTEHGQASNLQHRPRRRPRRCPYRAQHVAALLCVPCPCTPLSCTRCALANTGKCNVCMIRAQ